MRSKNIFENAQFLNESILINNEDIYYNKDKFDSGEINICFITGHSGSGKSTMGREMSSNNDTEHISLDNVISNWNFTDSDLKEYGDLIYSFFNGVGKKFRYISKKDWEMDPDWDNKDRYTDGYEASIIRSFVNYAIDYANSHKKNKFVIEGVWLFHFIKPQELKKYAVYIKGTSLLISKIRAAKRDSYNSNTRFIKQFFRNRVDYFLDEEKIHNYRNWFLSLQ